MTTDPPIGPARRRTRPIKAEHDVDVLALRTLANCSATSATPQRSNGSAPPSTT